MKKGKKTIDIFIAEDGEEFTSESQCEKHEESLMLSLIHKKLCSVKFFSRFRIESYYHNVEIGYLRDNPFSFDFDGFVLMHGRMGNGDDLVIMKVDGDYIKLLKGYTEDDEKEYKYLGRIHKSILLLEGEEFTTAIDKYLLERENMFNHSIKVKEEQKALAIDKVSHLSKEEKEILGIKI